MINRSFADLVAVVFLVSFLFSSTGFAQKKKKKIARDRKVMVSFDEDLVEGNLTGAELFLILQKKAAKFEKLFDLRKNFIPEMYQNSENLPY